MFLVMVWHGRRRLAATQERLTAMEELQRIEENSPLSTLTTPSVQAIAEAHHGSVRVRSASDHGSTFEIVLPAVSGAAG